MFSWIRKIIPSKSNTPNFKKLVDAGAVIIDVRSAQEFRSGHIKGSLNVPLQNIDKEILSLQKLKKPVITCCLSGGRSSVAKRILLQKGIDVYNGGGWRQLEGKLGKA